MTAYVTKMVDSYMKIEGPNSKKETPPTSTDNKKPTPASNTGQTPPTSDEKDTVRVQPDALVNAKGKLKPTETVERTHPVVGTSSGGRGHNIQDDKEKKEFFDKDELLTKKVKTVAKWMKGSKHVIFFTGAGISTRYGGNVMLKTFNDFPLSFSTPSFPRSLLSSPL